MKRSIIYVSTLILLAVSITGCSAIEGIFKAGAYTGIIAVIVVIIIIAVIVKKVSSGGNK